MDPIKAFQNISPVIRLTALVFLVAIIAVCGCSSWYMWQSLLSGAEPATPTAIVFVTAVPDVGEPVDSVPPTPVTFDGWRGEYFDNPKLDGEPVLVRDDESIMFDWGPGLPVAGVPADNFSVRWTITLEDVAAGVVRFTTRFDNGMRVWLDDHLVIDQWHQGPVRDATADVNVVAGNHTVRVEYYHLTGPAVAQLKVEEIQNFPDWKAEYFDQPNLNNPPVVVRNEKEVNYDWGPNSPAPGVVPDNYFAARFSRSAYANEGTYRFVLNVEGGVRLWIDGQIALDSWGEKHFRQVETISKLSAGEHGFKLEYFKETGNGQLSTRYVKLQEPKEPPLAVIHGKTQAEVGEIVDLTARYSSSAEDSRLVNYLWNLGDGTQAEGIDVTHTYQSAGEYEVKLIVTDDKGLENATTHKIVVQGSVTQPPEDQAPQPVIQSPSQANVGEVVLFDGTLSRCVDQCVSYVWDMGDGSVYNALAIQHVYLSPAAYIVTLTVTDDKGRQSSAVKQIAVK